MKKKFIPLGLVLFLLSNLSYSQSRISIGLSGSVQSNQFGILLPIWLGEKFVLAPAFDLKFVDKTGTEFSFGLAPRFYFNHEKLAPYFGLKVGTIMNFPSSDNDIDAKIFDILAGLAFGAEYFLTDRLSVGVEAQGNFTISDKDSDRFGNPGGLNFNTATMVSVTIYF